jgi:hypothetical protein
MRQISVHRPAHLRAIAGVEATGVSEALVPATVLHAGCVE